MGWVGERALGRTGHVVWWVEAVGRFDRYRFNLYLKGLTVDGDFDGGCGQVADFNGIPLPADLNSEDGYRQPPLLMGRARNWSRRPAARQALVTLPGP